MRTAEGIARVYACGVTCSASLTSDERARLMLRHELVEADGGEALLDEETIELLVPQRAQLHEDSILGNDSQPCKRENLVLTRQPCKRENLVLTRPAAMVKTPLHEALKVASHRDKELAIALFNENPFKLGMEMSLADARVAEPTT